VKISTGIVITLSEDEFDIESGNNIMPEIMLNGANIASENYSLGLNIISNDPDEDTLYVPITLNILDTPGISVSADTLNFGQVFVNGDSMLSLTVTNIGSDTLEINNIMLSSDVFYWELAGGSKSNLPQKHSPQRHRDTELRKFGVPTYRDKYLTESSTPKSASGSKSTIILPGESENYNIYFNPDSVQMEIDSLIIVSNDPTNLTKAIKLIGQGISAPEMELTPEEMEFSVTTEDSILQTLTIENAGGNPLDFRFYPRLKTDSMLWHYAYVVNHLNNRLSIINLETQSVNTITGFYSRPYCIDITPDGKYLWITYTNDNEISIYNLETGVHKIISASGNDRRGTAFSPDGSIAYVADLTNNRIEIYNAITHELLETFNININDPQWLDVTPDGKYLYISDTGTDKIIVMDTETYTEVTNLSGFNDPWEIEISPDGEWFAFRDGDNVKIGSTESNTIIANVPNIDNPRTPIWSPDNRYLYVGSWDAYKIHKIETDSFTVSKEWILIYKPWSIHLSEDSKYLVAALYDNDRVAIIDMDTDEIDYLTVGDGPTTITTFRTKQPIWLENISQLSGTLQPDSLVNISLQFNTTSLLGGDYYAELPFTTNDPLANEFVYDIILHHNTGSPYLYIGADSLDFDNVWVDFPDSVNLTISNTGTETLNITSINCNPAQFYTTETTLSLEADSSYILTIYCTATSPGLLTGDITITSNGGNKTANLQAYAIEPPIVSVIPTTIEKTLMPDEMDSETVNLSNIGNSDLTYYTTVGMHKDKYFIGNNNKYQVHIWNPETGIIDSVDLLFSGPWRMKYSPDGRELWITYEDAGYVTVLDAYTNEVLDNIHLEGSRTSGVAFNKTGTYAYIGNWSQNRVEIINTATHSWEGSITGSMNAPKELVTSPDSSKLFVTNHNNDDLVIVDLTTNTVLQSIDGYSTGYDILVSPDGEYVYWVDRYYVRKVDVETSQILQTSANLGELRGIAISDACPVKSSSYFTEDGEVVYVCAYGNNKILALETETLTTIDEFTGITNPIDITLSYDRKYLYVTWDSDNKVSKIDIENNLIEDTYSLGASDIDFRNITSAGRVCWLSVDLESDTLSVGNSNSINFVLNTEDLSAGVYSADFGIYSNDPGEPELIIPIELSVGASPFILSIYDVPGDSGKQVYVNWIASPYDKAGASTPISHYSIWRRMGLKRDNPVTKENGLKSKSQKTREDYELVIDTVSAVQDSEYICIAPTLVDSTEETGIQWSVFKVCAHTDNPSIFYFSLPDSGYSIDNTGEPIIPQQVVDLTITIDGNNVVLSWTAVTQDISGNPITVDKYNIYRSDNPYDVFSTENLLDDTSDSDTFYIDNDVLLTSGKYFYVVTAEVEDGVMLKVNRNVIKKVKIETKD